MWVLESIPRNPIAGTNWSPAHEKFSISQEAFFQPFQKPVGMFRGDIPIFECLLDASLHGFLPGLLHLLEECIQVHPGTVCDFSEGFPFLDLFLEVCSRESKQLQKRSRRMGPISLCISNACFEDPC